MASQLKVIHCKIVRGGFSGERGFKIKLANGDEYVSLAAVGHLFKADKTPLEKHEPPEKEEISGYVAARSLKKEGPNSIVEVPDGQLVMVNGCLDDYPQEKPQHVSV